MATNVLPRPAQQETRANDQHPSDNIQYHRISSDSETHQPTPEITAASEHEAPPNSDSEQEAAAAAAAACCETATQSPWSPNQETKLEPPLKQKRFQRLRHKYGVVTSDHWSYELLAVGLCASTLLSIVAILFAYQGGPTPHIMGGVSVS